MSNDRQTAKGTYLLLIRLNQATKLTIGRLGTFHFPAGWYAYAGSALGPGGIQARLARHLRAEKRVHWHIDYLLEHGAVGKSWQIASPARLECAWAAAIRQLPRAELLVPHFGASDCRCPGHLIYWPHRPSDRQIADALRNVSPEARSIQCNVHPTSTSRGMSSPLRAQTASINTYSPPETSECPPNNTGTGHDIAASVNRRTNGSAMASGQKRSELKRSLAGGQTL